MTDPDVDRRALHDEVEALLESDPPVCPPNRVQQHTLMVGADDE